MVSKTTTSEEMQECVDDWIIDIQNSIRTLRNIPKHDVQQRLATV